MADNQKYYLVNRGQFVGTSQDEKPTDSAPIENLRYSLYLELDTGKFFYADVEGDEIVWKEIGNNG